jgi:pimeloyl-ACP methyl ester carboxylesterase
MEKVEFFSQGVKIAGVLELPPGSGPDAVHPAVVTCAGWGGTKDRSLPEFASRLTKHGFAVLRFDFRGYGESDGVRNRIYPLEQTADIRAAAAFLRGHPNIDAGRIAVLGVLTGAAAALQAASEDRGIAAVIGFFPFGDGERWMRSLRRAWEWREFEGRLEADRHARSLSGASPLLDPNEILLRDAHGAEREAKSREASQARRDWKLGLDTADAIIAFRPEDHVARIAPRGVMFVAIEEDSMSPIEEVERLYALLESPKRLLVLSGIRHHDIYEPERFTGVMDEVAAFLDASLAGSRN